MFSKYKNVFFNGQEKIIKTKIRIITPPENLLEDNLIVQGNNINNIRNLKNYQHDQLKIQLNSPINNKNDYCLTPHTNETRDNNKKRGKINKSESITNSNMNTNPSTICKADSLTNNIDNFQILSKDNSIPNVLFIFLI